jgi:hypothetical protein
MKIHAKLAFLAALTLGGPVAAESDVEIGKQLTDEHCYACHGNEIYTREDRRVTSRPGLTVQVQRCEQALSLTWFDDQIDSVAEYLNRSFYHFDR